MTWVLDNRLADYKTTANIHKNYKKTVSIIAIITFIMQPSQQATLCMQSIHLSAYRGAELEN